VCVPPIVVTCRGGRRCTCVPQGIGHHGASSTTDSDQPMRLEPLRGRPYWTSPGWSDHDLRAATPAAERGPGRGAGLAQSPIADHVPDASGHHCGRAPPPAPAHRGTLAMPNSRGRRGRTGHNLTGNEALADDSSCLCRRARATRSSAEDSRSVVKYATMLHTTRRRGNRGVGPDRQPSSS
jgi:hypothetical protein